MKASKVTVGDHPWKPYVTLICEILVALAAALIFLGALVGMIDLPWPLFAMTYAGFVIPALFDVYQWIWKWRIRRWTMKNSEWLYDELHPRPTHDDI